MAIQNWELRYPACLLCSHCLTLPKHPDRLPPQPQQSWNALSQMGQLQQHNSRRQYPGEKTWLNLAVSCGFTGIVLYDRWLLVLSFQVFGGSGWFLRFPRHDGLGKEARLPHSSRIVLFLQYHFINYGPGPAHRYLTISTPNQHVAS